MRRIFFQAAQPFLVVCSFAAAIPVAFAQPVVLRPEADISRLRVLPPELPETESYDLTVRSPEKTAVPRDIESIDFFVSKVEVQGVTRYAPDEVAAVFADLEGRNIRLEELRAKADLLQARYTAEGFLLTRVIIPPQEIEDGRVVIQVVEGYIAEGFYSSGNKATERLARQALLPLIGERPLSIRRLDSTLLILNDAPGVSVTSTLRPSKTLGAADIVVTSVTPKGQGFVNATNTGSTALGPAIYTLSYSFASPFGRPGSLDLSATAAGAGLDELRAGSVRYGTPIGAQGTVLYVGALVAKARPSGEVAALGVESQSYSLEARIRQALVRTRATSIYAEAALLMNDTLVQAVGTEVTDDRIVTAQFGARIRHQLNRAGEFTAQLFVSQGIPIWGALNTAEPNPSVLGFAPKFTKIHGQIEHRFTLAPRMTLLSRAMGQWTSDRLLSGEQIAFGGPFIGRGYVPSVVVGDRGVGLLAELQVDFPALAIPNLVAGVQGYAFTDAGWAEVLPTEEVPGVGRSIVSHGVGLRGRLFERVIVDAQLSFAERTIAGAENRGSRFNTSITYIF